MAFLFMRLFISVLLIAILTYSFPCSAESKTKRCQPSPTRENRYYVSLQGQDYGGTGSILKPWRTISYAVQQAKDNSTILVSPGIYQGEIRLKKAFAKGITIQSQFAYQAKLINNARVVAFVGDAKNITFEGFEISHINKNAKPVVMQIDGYGTDKVKHINIRNNIIHDSFNNDLLKINYAASNIIVECNMFYNQGDSDEHIDINSVANVTIQDNVFFNDYKKSNRQVSLKSSSYIVIKDSNGKEDRFLGSQNITINRNVFFNWQGSYGQGFILIGEDGKPYFEANNIIVSNNLMLGNSSYVMRSPFGIKGAHNIYFVHNTISGDLPSKAFATRINKEGQNPTNTNIYFIHNIWNDPFGTMGSEDQNSSNDFSDTLPTHLSKFSLVQNLYWNGGNALPSSLLDKINPSDDSQMMQLNPLLPLAANIISPVWHAESQLFLDGSFTIREAFLRLIYYYGIPQYKLQAIKRLPNEPRLVSDILDKNRNITETVGAIQLGSATSK